MNYALGKDCPIKESAMDGKRTLLLGFRFWAFVGLMSATAAVQAAPPWSNLMSLKGVSADPNKKYMLSEENGPWMIMACTFSGEGAEKQAQELVLELRKRYKLPAYMANGRIDPGEAQGRGFDKNGNLAKWKYNKYKNESDPEKRRHPELNEIAVLVGNYGAANDKDAQETLRKIKYAKPNCLELKENQATHQTLTGWRYAQQKVYEAIGSEKKMLGPMRHSFIVINPKLPPDFCAPKGVEPEIVALNKGVPFSLLDCPGKYTVQVATFRGNAVIKQEDIQDIEEGKKKMGSRLAQAAENADKLTHRLRELGYDAYQFHDRFTSIVTVGSFDSPGTVQPNGQVEPGAKARRIIEVFGPQSDRDSILANRPEYQNLIKAQGLEKQSVAVEPKYITVSHNEIIPFDVQPTVVQVPKRSFSSTMRGEE
jgi:hypothetical protein